MGEKGGREGRLGPGGHRDSLPLLLRDPGEVGIGVKGQNLLRARLRAGPPPMLKCQQLR